MRRSMLLCAVLAIGCATQDKAPADSGNAMKMAPPPTPTNITLADVAGIWEGTATAMGSDSVLVNQTLTATADTTGWSMKVANAKTPTKTSLIGLMKVTAAGDSITAETAAFESVLRPGVKVTTHTVFRLQGGKLVGMIHATYPNNEMVMLASTLTRKPPG